VGGGGVCVRQGGVGGSRGVVGGLGATHPEEAEAQRASVRQHAVAAVGAAEPQRTSRDAARMGEGAAAPVLAAALFRRISPTIRAAHANRIAAPPRPPMLGGVKGKLAALGAFGAP